MREWYGDRNQQIYLDYQASTPMDSRVISAMVEHYSVSFANPHATDHALGWAAHKAIEDASAKIAGVLQVDADEIIFTSGATEANNLALLGLARRALPGRRRILVSAIEHRSILAAARAAERVGIQVDFLPVTDEGIVDPAELMERLGDDVLLVSVMAVNNEVGSLQPVKALADAAHGVGALFHTDAVHAPTAGIVDMAEVDADLASFSAHKIYGPKGIGCLYVRRDLHDRIEPLMYGGGQQQGLRPGTLPVPLCVGFAVAMGLMAGAEADAERKRIATLRDLFVERLRRAIPCVLLNGPRLVGRHPGNANLRFAGFDAYELLAMMQPRIAASTGSACASGSVEPSHVLRALGLSIADTNASVRFGIGRFTSSRDIDEAIAVIVGTANKYDDGNKVMPRNTF